MPSVLVVDDSTTDRHVVGILLTKAGDWNIQYAVQGRDALEQMENHEFDLVLTDLVMPGMDGLDLVAAIRGRHPHVPVILMTSRGNQTLALQALKQGAVDYIPKRLMPRKLTGTIRRVMAVACREREHVRLLGSMAEFRSSFVLANDVALIQPLVRYLQENVLVMRLCDEVECMQIGIALGAVPFNTLYHGNLEVALPAHRERRGVRIAGRPALRGTSVLRPPDTHGRHAHAGPRDFRHPRRGARLRSLASPGPERHLGPGEGQRARPDPHAALHG